MSAPHDTRPFTHAFHPAGGRPVRVGFVTAHNPHDRTSFSGTAHHAFQALSARPDLDVRLLGGHRPVSTADRLLRRYRLNRPVTVAPAELRGLDVVVGLVATSLLDEGVRTSGVPYIHVTDAVPSFLRDVYGWDVPITADVAERRVVAQSLLTVYSSRHMMRRAQGEFGPAAHARTAAIPFGVNLDALPVAVPEKPGLTPLRLVWVGSSWDRKGGPEVLAILDVLRAQGVAVEVTMVGAIPDAVRGYPGVTVAGYLDKNRPHDLARLSGLYAGAHLLVLPTRADCTPMVVAEANAHGTPAIVTDVGGVASLMDGDRNGALMPLAAGPRAWADRILALTRNPEAHAALCRSSLAHVRARLTWDAWARDLAAHVHAGLARVPVAAE